MWTQLPFPKRDSPQFLAHVCCGQTAGWNKMSLDREVGRSPGHIVLDRDPTSPSSPTPPQKGGTADPTFWPMYCGQTAAWIKMPLGVEVGLGPGHIVLDGASSPQRSTPQFSAHVCCGQTAGWIKDQDVTWQAGSCLGPGDIVLDGDPAPLKRGTTSRQPL